MCILYPEWHQDKLTQSTDQRCPFCLGQTGKKKITKKIYCGVGSQMKWQTSFAYSTGLHFLYQSGAVSVTVINLQKLVLSNSSHTTGQALVCIVSFTTCINTIWQQAAASAGRSHVVNSSSDCPKVTKECSVPGKTPWEYIGSTSHCENGHRCLIPFPDALIVLEEQNEMVVLPC